MWPVPQVVEVLLAILALCFELLVNLNRLGGLVENLARSRRTRGVLVGRAADFVAWPLHTAVVSRLQVGCRALVIWLQATNWYRP